MTPGIIAKGSGLHREGHGRRPQLRDLHRRQRPLARARLRHARRGRRVRHVQDRLLRREHGVRLARPGGPQSDAARPHNHASGRILVSSTGTPAPSAQGLGVRRVPPSPSIHPNTACKVRASCGYNASHPLCAEYLLIKLPENRIPLGLSRNCGEAAIENVPCFVLELIMNFLPIELMMRRVETNSADSDALRFAELLYAGEFILKLTTAAFVSAVEDDVESNRYRLLHALVRADGIGARASRLDDVLTGPASQHISPRSRNTGEFSTSVSMRLVGSMRRFILCKRCLRVFMRQRHSCQPESRCEAGLRSSPSFEIKQRGHGATTPATCAKLIPAFQKAVSLYP